MGVKLNSSIAKASLFLFRMDLTNLISRVKAKYNNQDEYNGDQVYKKENIGKAFIQGVEFNIKYSPFKNLMLIKNITYTYGKNTTKNEPINFEGIALHPLILTEQEPKELANIFLKIEEKFHRTWMSPLPARASRVITPEKK